MFIGSSILAAGALIISGCQDTKVDLQANNQPEGQYADTKPPAGVDRGQELFFEYCAVCHGERGERGAAPLRDTIQNWIDADLAGIIFGGVPKRGMPAMTNLTTEEIQELTGFLRSWIPP